MNIIVCDQFYNNNIVNTTGDYNICKGLLLLEEQFDNFKCISHNEFTNNQLELYKKVVEYFQSELNSIILIQTNSIPFLQDYPKNVKQYRYIVDIHGWNMNNYPNHLLLPYAYCYNIYNYKPNTDLYFFPHCAKYNSEFNQNPINKILVSGRGRKNPSRYPMRVFMYDRSLKDERIDYFKPDHSYRENIKKCEQVTCGGNFIKKLNAYRVCFSDDMIYYSPYLVCKFFEILSSGALLLASFNHTKPYISNLGFIDGEHYISISKEDYNEKIEYIFDEKNSEEIDRIRLAGYNLCNMYHTSEHRALQLKEIIENTQNVKKYTDGIGNTEYYMVTN
jgi:hypothetical protein